VTDGPRDLPAALAAAKTGRVVLRGAGGAVATDWQALYAGGRRVATSLRRAGVAPGARLLLVLPSGEDALAALFGCFLAGVVPSFVSPPAGVGSEATFRRLIGPLAAQPGVIGLVAQEKLVGLLGEAAPAARVLGAAELRAGDDDPPAAPVDPDAVGYVQLTSGTTRAPKAAAISHGAIAANVRQIGARIRIRPGDAVVGWLPLFHDMGLFGALLVPLFHDADLDLARPIDFLRRPASWLRAISDRAPQRVISPAPAFAFRYVVARCRDRDLDGLDLSGWDTALCGAEPIHAAVLEAFEARLAPAGLPEAALSPCYGLAEATLAVTITPPDERRAGRTVSRAALAGAGAVEPPAGDDDALELVGCGTPLAGTRVRIVGEDGAELPPGRLGEVVVEGPSLFAGYLDAEGAPERPGGPLRTGDLGFVSGEHLYVTGRRKDVIILRGHNHHPEEVEWVAAKVPGVRSGRVAAFGLSDPAKGTERLCVLLEAEARSGPPAGLEQAVRRRVLEESGLAIDRLLVADRGTIPLTTSGKVRRAEARRVYLALVEETAS